MDFLEPQQIGFVIALLLSGAVSGFAAGLFGIGGGAIMVPVLYFVFGQLGYGQDVIMHCAVATSSAVIIPSSIRSVLSHNRYGVVDWNILFPKNPLKSWGLWIAAGSLFAAGYLARHISGEALTLIFGVMAAFLSLQFMIGRPDKAMFRGLPTGIGIPVSGSVIGALSALMGIGGGSITVSFMVLCAVPIRRAIATASGIGVFISAPATIGYIISGWDVPGRPPTSLGYVSGLGFVILALTVMIFIPMGARMTYRLDQSRLVKLFGLFLFLVSLNMIRKALGY